MRPNCVLIVGQSPAAPTGYGRMSRELAKGLKRRGFNVKVAGTYHPMEDKLYGDEVIPMSPYAHEVKNDLNILINQHKIDCIITIEDVFVAHRFGDLISRFMPYLKWYPWVGIDGYPLHASWPGGYASAKRLITISEFGRELLAGLCTNQQVDLIYPGVDRTVFFPIGDRARLKQQYPFNNFVVLMVSMLWVRQGYDKVLEGFKKFLDRGWFDPTDTTQTWHPINDAILYLQTDPNMVGGPSLTGLAVLTGVPPEKIVLPSMHYGLGGLTDQELNVLYNGADILMRPSKGEGFGLPVLEMMATRGLVAGTDFSALPELLKGRGFLLENRESVLEICQYPGIDILQDNFGHYRATVSSEDIAKTLKFAYDAYKGSQSRIKAIERYKDAAYQFALYHTWDKCVDVWADTISDVRITKYFTTTPKVEHKVAVMVPWEEKCGIYEHTRIWLEAYVNNGYYPITVLAPYKCFPKEEADPLIDIPVFNCWHRGSSDYTDLIKHIKGLGITILHIQHEYSFFNQFTALVNLVRHLHRDGVKVIVHFHTVFGRDMFPHRVGLLDLVSDIDQYIIAFTEGEEAIVEDGKPIGFRRPWMVSELGMEAFKKHNYIPLAHRPYTSMSGEDRTQLRTELGFTEKHLVLGSNGFWQEHKGYLELVYAASRLKAMGSPVKVLIVGMWAENHPVKTAFDKLVNDLNMQEEVTLISGYLPYQRMLQYIECTDILVYYQHKSRQGSASASVLTGISTGRPVITADVSICPYYEGEVYRVIPEDANALALGIMDICYNDDKRVQMKVAQNKLLAISTPESVAEATARVYQKTIAS